MRQLSKIRKNDKGFTLVELMIVVAIIGILAAIAIPQFAQYRLRGFVATINSDVKNAFTSSVAYTTDNPAAVEDDMTQDNFELSGYVASPNVTVETTLFANISDYELTATMDPNPGLVKATAEIDTAGTYSPASIL